ncbi:MAG TPA: hypothetical protein VNW99_10655 [Cytophagaceae bacterium]|nr:hypothetical protein [Cytophagaceae bacterium]
MKAVLFTLMILFSVACHAQLVTKEFKAPDLDALKVSTLQKEFGSKKMIPAAYEKQALLALSFYPELKEIHIEFREMKMKSTLKAFPTPGSSVFRSAGKRTYVVAICTQYKQGMSPITFDKLPFNAQVGILGHELAHISYFVKKSRLGMLSIALVNISKTRTDRFEYMTDGIAIAHGLGWQLLDWSEFIRKTLNIKSYRGIQYYLKMKEKSRTPSDQEKYMNPETIRKFIAGNPIYQ